MKVANVFYVTSPLQYLCAFEARKAFDASCNILILEVGDTVRGLEQLQQLISRDNWDCTFELKTGNRTFTTPAFIRKLKRYLSSHGLSIDHFCFGEFASWRVNLVRKNLSFRRTVYFDDGTLSINEVEKYIKPAIPYSRKRWFHDLLLRLQGVQPVGVLPVPDNLLVYSMFDFSDELFDSQINQFADLLSRFDSFNAYDAQGPVAFIGQGAIGHKNQKTLDAHLKEIMLFTDNKAQKVVYFPHRNESEAVTKAVEAIKSVEYHTPDRPMELEILTKRLTFSRVVGPYSTALFTLKKLFPELPVTLIDDGRQSQVILEIRNQLNKEQILDSIITKDGHFESLN
ncbi:alpha-2,8-polysialyltransferase family protein [Vibrio mediterranei]|nr:alpha-2,8-polysialyltransferase family protein [Vibrio mediterranei]